MKYTIFIAMWLLLGNPYSSAQSRASSQGYPIEMSGRKFSKGNETNIKFGWTAKRLGPYLEGEQAQATYAQARQMMRKGNITAIASTTLVVATLPLVSTRLSGYIAMGIGSAVSFLPYTYYIRGSQLVNQAIAEHNAFVGAETPSMNSSFK